MPELPEVETVRCGLAARLGGRRIAGASVMRPDLRFPFPEALAVRIGGRRIERIDRRAKYLIMRLSGGLNLIAHLGMTGRFTLENRPLAAYALETGLDARHDHLVIVFDDGVRLVYNDPRRFGFILLMDDAELAVWPPLAALGPEPLDEHFSGAYLRAALRGRTTSAKSALMDQAVVAGLGNIYVCEALFRAGVSPFRRAGLLSAERLHRLAGAIRSVLLEAIAAGGSTISDFAHADGSRGGFQQAFSVYGREGLACPACDRPVRRRVQSGRSTFYCAACQK
jgi:formamidopyrimidine-DNA glycosylase